MKAFLQFPAFLACSIVLFNCGHQQQKDGDSGQENPGESRNTFNLVPGSDAFSKFNCVVKGEPLGPEDSSVLKKMFTPVPKCSGLGLRQVGSAFSSNIIKMDVDVDGNFYLLMESFDVGDVQKFYGKFSFIKLDSTGKQIFEVKSKEDNVFESFAVHPSGELTIVETRKVSSNGVVA